MSKAFTVKTAFLGCGRMGDAHWRGIQQHAPQLQVTAVMDLDAGRAARLAAMTGAQAYASLEQALEQGDFEAVDIMLPPNLHEHAALQAFAAGKHVLLEKPMATTLDACERILAAADQAGTVFMVAEQAQYQPDSVKIQQLIQDGAIGEIITAKASFDRTAPRNSDPSQWRYRNSISGGGMVIDGGSHWIRPLTMWMGPVEEVVAVLGYPLQEMEGESLAHAIFRFKSGLVATFEAHRAGSVRVPFEDFRVKGTQGVIVTVTGQTNMAFLYDHQHPDGISILAEDETREDAYGLELADFGNAVLQGTPLAAGPEESRSDLRIVLAMYRSAQSHQWEKVWD